MDECGLIYNIELEEYVYENEPDGYHSVDLSGGGGPVALPPPPISHRKSNKQELPQSPSSHHTLYQAEGGSNSPTLTLSNLTYPLISPLFTLPHSY